MCLRLCSAYLPQGRIILCLSKVSLILVLLGTFFTQFTVKIHLKEQMEFRWNYSSFFSSTCFLRFTGSILLIRILHSRQILREKANDAGQQRNLEQMERSFFLLLDLLPNIHGVYIVDMIALHPQQILRRKANDAGHTKKFGLEYCDLLALQNKSQIQWPKTSWENKFIVHRYIDYVCIGSTSRSNSVALHHASEKFRIYLVELVRMLTN